MPSPLDYDEHHQHLASDDGMKHPEDHPAQAVVEQRKMAPSDHEIEHYAHAHDKIMEDVQAGARRLHEAMHVGSATLGSWDLLDFQRRNVRRSEAPTGFDHPLVSWSLNDWLVALGGEVGEAMNVAKKIRRIETRSRGNRKPDDQRLDKLNQKLKDELADAFIYLLLVCASRNFDVPTIVEGKFLEVSKEIGYIDERGQGATLAEFAKNHTPKWND